MSSVVAISSERFGKAANRRGGGPVCWWRRLVVRPLAGLSASMVVAAAVASPAFSWEMSGARGRPVKGTVSRRAALALDWPARRFCDGYKRMGRVVVG